jgi:hypothetical protein
MKIHFLAPSESLLLLRFHSLASKAKKLREKKRQARPSRTIPNENGIILNEQIKWKNEIAFPR